MVLSLNFLERFRGGCVRGLFYCFAWVALAASAQSDSMDTFGGNPDSAKFLRIEPDAPDWTRHFRLGAMLGMNISADFKTRGTFAVSGNNPANGVYDDGYVREDDTGNAGGLTSYWGYNNASQYDSAAQTLSLHGASSYSATGSATQSGSAFVGFDMAYGDNLWYWKHARVGWEFGFGLLPLHITDASPMAATVSQSTFTFDTGGIVMPGAPYQGGSSGQGPVISDQFSTTTTNTAGTVTGSRTLDVMLYTFRLGPVFYWDLNEYFGMQLGAGPAFGIVSGTYKYNETITTPSGSTQNSGSFGFTDLTYGGYVNGTLLYHIINDADLYLGAQYMPMGNASFSSGGRSGQLNLGGQLYISAGIHWPF